MWDWAPPEASGLGVTEGAPVPELRPVCGVAGAEVALDDTGAGQRLGEVRGRCSGDDAGSHGEQMEGSETLLVKTGSWSLLALPHLRSWEELWSELEDRLSVLRAGEGEQEEGSEGGRTGKKNRVNGNRRKEPEFKAVGRVKRRHEEKTDNYTSSYNWLSNMDI